MIVDIWLFLASVFKVRNVLACCFLRLEWSICPLAVGAGHSQPSSGFPARSQRASKTARTRGVMGRTRRAAAVFPCVIVPDSNLALGQTGAMRRFHLAGHFVISLTRGFAHKRAIELKFVPVHISAF